MMRLGKTQDTHLWIEV